MLSDLSKDMLIKLIKSYDSYRCCKYAQSTYRREISVSEFADITCHRIRQRPICEYDRDIEAEQWLHANKGKPMINRGVTDDNMCILIEGFPRPILINTFISILTS